MVSKEKHIFPYGACKIVSDKLVSLKEKPKFDFITNTGLYFVKKEIIKLIPKNELFNMTDLINKCLKLKKRLEFIKFKIIHGQTLVNCLILIKHQKTIKCKQFVLSAQEKIQLD